LAFFVHKKNCLKMRLKIFQASSVANAMQDIRVELGGDALILSTRRTRSGVEVTAGVDTIAPVPVAEPARQDLLAWHGLPATIGAKLQAGALPFALQVGFRFARLNFAGAPPLVCVGPPGAGKTLTVVRLATRLVLAGQTPLILSTDSCRAGANAQLLAYTAVLGVRLIAIDNPADVGQALQDQPGPVLIDTAGCSPYDPAGLGELAAIGKRSGARIALVLPAGQDAMESQDAATAFAAAGASLLIATKLDIARRIGGVLAAAAVGLTMIEAGISANAADGLTPLTPQLLSERLLSRRSPGVLSQ
jgi:flagellar biosynthesis protein FlhF